MKFLFECLSEEIPVTMQIYAYRGKAGASPIIDEMCSSFKHEGLDLINIAFHATCRRITVVADVEPKSHSGNYENIIKGPKVVGSKPSAIEGFNKKIEGLRKNNNNVEPCECEFDGDMYYCVKITSESGDTLADINNAVKNALLKFLKSFKWPKSMHWGTLANTENRWVRPIRSILCLLDGEVVKFKYAGVDSSNITYGNKFLYKEKINKNGNVSKLTESDTGYTHQSEETVDVEIECTSIDDYLNNLKENFVLLDLKDRKQHVLGQLRSLKKNHKLETKLLVLNEKTFDPNKKDAFDGEFLDQDDGYPELVERMFFVSEYPVLFVGDVDLNKEVIDWTDPHAEEANRRTNLNGALHETSGNVVQKIHVRKIPNKIAEAVISNHQKYIACYVGEDLTNFIAAANTANLRVKLGHKKTLVARLQDVSLIIQEDFTPSCIGSLFSDYRPDLGSDFQIDDVLFTLPEKLTRMARLSRMVGDIALKSKMTNDLWGNGCNSKVEDLLAFILWARIDAPFKLLQEFPELRGFAVASYFKACKKFEFFPSHSCPNLFRPYPKHVESANNSTSDQGNRFEAEYYLRKQFLQALEEQYEPLSNSSMLPALLAPRIVGITERIDSLIMLRMTGATQSGAGDKFGLGRASTGLLRLLLGDEKVGGINIDARILIRKSFMLLFNDYLRRGWYWHLCEKLWDYCNDFFSGKTPDIIPDPKGFGEIIENYIVLVSAQEIACQKDEFGRAPSFYDENMKILRQATSVTDEQEQSLTEEWKSFLKELSRKTPINPDKEPEYIEWNEMIREITEWNEEEVKKSRAKIEEERKEELKRQTLQDDSRIVSYYPKLYVYIARLAVFVEFANQCCEVIDLLIKKFGQILEDRGINEKVRIAIEKKIKSSKCGAGLKLQNVCESKVYNLLIENIPQDKYKWFETNKPDGYDNPKWVEVRTKYDIYRENYPTWYLLYQSLHKLDTCVDSKLDTCINSTFDAQLNFFAMHNLAISANNFISSDNGLFVISVYKRIHNMLNKRNEEDGNASADVALDPGFKRLFDDVKKSYKNAEEAVDNNPEEFDKVFTKMHRAYEEVNNFIEGNKILCNDMLERKRNLNLLSKAEEVVNDVIDFSGFIK